MKVEGSQFMGHVTHRLSKKILSLALICVLSPQTGKRPLVSKGCVSSVQLAKNGDGHPTP